MSSSNGDLDQSQVPLTELAMQIQNVQETMKGVVQSLERLERVAEGVDRPDAVKRSQIGDENHTDVSTILSGLNVKFMCLQGVLGAYNNQSYRNQCVSHLYQWYQKRQGQHSPMLTQAALDSVSACLGKFQMKFEQVQLSEGELSDCAVRMYEACCKWHDMTDKVNADPEEYLRKKQVLKVYTDGRMREDDSSDLLAEIYQDLQTQREKSNPEKTEKDSGNPEHQTPQSDPSSPAKLENDTARTAEPELIVELPTEFYTSNSETIIEIKVLEDDMARFEDSERMIVLPIETYTSERETNVLIKAPEDDWARSEDSARTIVLPIEIYSWDSESSVQNKAFEDKSARSEVQEHAIVLTPEALTLSSEPSSPVTALGADKEISFLLEPSKPISNVVQEGERSEELDYTSSAIMPTQQPTNTESF